jgi:hypothetical protein
MSLAHGAQSLYAMASEAMEKICFKSGCRKKQKTSEFGEMPWCEQHWK